MSAYIIKYQKNSKFVFAYTLKWPNFMKIEVKQFRKYSVLQMCITFYYFSWSTSYYKLKHNDLLRKYFFLLIFFLSLNCQKKINSWSNWKFDFLQKWNTIIQHCDNNNIIAFLTCISYSNKLWAIELFIFVFKHDTSFK